MPEKLNLDVVFDVPRILSNNKFTHLKIKKKYNKNIWPTTIPTSGISFKRAFFENCLEFNLFDSYPTLEIDFRLNFFAQRIQRKFLTIKENLTIYRKVNDGIMSNVNFFSYNKFNWISFYDKDHGDRDGSSLVEWVHKNLKKNFFNKNI